MSADDICRCTGPHWMYFGRCETCGGFEEAIVDKAGALAKKAKVRGHGPYCQDDACNDEAQTIACAHGRLDVHHQWLLKLMSDIGEAYKDMGRLLDRIRALEGTKH